MTPIQQLMLGAGGAKKTYMDDVFSTYLFKGNGSTGQTINNGINLSGEGGMVWNKDRENTYDHVLWDTVRGDDYILNPNASNSGAGQTNSITYNSNGYTVNGGQGNENNNKTTSWTFRKAPGFFDVVTYTGNGTAYRAIDHQLGCVPGMLIVKRTDASGDWQILHRKHYGTTSNYSSLKLNSTAAEYDSWSEFNRTNPTATQFTVSNDPSVNATGGTYICYLFGGGESTAATARSVNQNPNSDYFQTSTGSDYTFGTGDFTIEGWFWPESSNDRGFFMQAPSGSTGIQTNYAFNCHVNTTLRYRLGSGSTTGSTTQDTGVTMPIKQWSHVAFVRSSGVFSIYFNGTLVDTQNDTTNYNGTDLVIGAYHTTNYLHDGKISNFRVVKGTAVYTSSFRPPTEPLTNITNTKLLCFNNSSTTGTTVGTITVAAGSPTASTDSPFDDPAGFVFGDAGDQNVIKTGSYKGTGADAGAEINLGWEPQWVLIKEIDASNRPWVLVDSMRGISTGGNDPLLSPSSTAAESGPNFISLTSTGFKFVTAHGDYNGSSGYIYMAIRRPDPLVQKPAKLGTEVFAMDAGNGSSTIPTFDSGFPVDFSIVKNPTIDESWLTSGRLLQLQRHIVNDTNNVSAESTTSFDSNVGCWTDISSAMQAFMWKRHAGFDCITYTGNNVNGRHLRHNLSKPPEMVWFKVIANGSGVNWMAGHKGLNGGTNPWHYYIEPNTNSDQTDYPAWMDTAPTSTHIAVSNVNQTNNTDNKRYVAMLFASVSGISKCGYYDGSSSAQTITTGFQPRFVIIKASSAAYPWVVLDTTRGWGSGNDQWLQLNDSSEQQAFDQGAPTSTGFTVPVGSGQSTYVNENNQKYIYYAHA